MFAQFSKSIFFNAIFISALGFYSSLLYAGWCEGSKYLLMEMKLSEQLKAAHQASNETIQELQSEKSQINQDMKTLKQLRTRYTQLSQDTVALCQQGRYQDFPIHYQEMTLDDERELKHQINLNLVLLQAQREDEAKTIKRYRKLKQLEQSIIEKYEMLTLLQKNSVTQSEIEGDPLKVRQFVQSSCHAVKQGRTLLKESRKIKVGSFIKNIIRTEAPQSLPETELDQFLSDCIVNNGAGELAQESWLKSKVRSVGNWF